MKFYLLLIILIFCSFTFFDKRPKHIRLSHDISDKFVKEMEKKGFLMALYGGGFIDKVNEVHLGFSTKKPHSINESRKILLDNVEDLLRRYNEYIEIRPYLINYPFEPCNLDIFIMLNENIPKSDTAILRSVRLCKNDILFRFSGSEANINQRIKEESLLNTLPENESLDLLSRQNFRFNNSIYHETYDEAYRLVYGHKRSMDHP